MNTNCWQWSSENDFIETHFLPFKSLQILILNNFFSLYITFITRKRHPFSLWLKNEVKRTETHERPTLVFIFLNASSPIFSMLSNLRSFLWNNSKKLSSSNYYTGTIHVLHWKMTLTLFITGHKSPWSIILESLLLKVPGRQKNNTVLPQHHRDLQTTKSSNTGKVLYINT